MRVLRLVAILTIAVGGCSFRPAAVAPSDAGTDDSGGTDAGTFACPAGYASFDGSATKYRVIESTASWSTAAADCEDDDDGLPSADGHTHLVVVGSETEKAALTGRFRGFPTVGQEPPWDGGDPDGGLAENCVRFKNSFDFEDKPCTDANSYVCECDRYPLR